VINLPAPFVGGPGLCTTLPLETVDRLFFGQGPSAKAVAICNDCPVQAQCLQWATDNRIYDGVWGGEGQGARRERLGLSSPDTFPEPVLLDDWASGAA
jgi:hypothetical protein